MALPANWTMVEVRGTYLGLNGNPLSGRLTFTPNAARLTNPSEDLVILSHEPIEAVLDNDGFFEVSIPASDDPDVIPVGFTWHVQESFGPKQSYDIIVLESDAATGLDISDRAPSNPSGGVYSPAVSDAEFDAFVATKGQPNGIAPLDGTGKVPTANLPAGVGGGGGPDPDAVKLTGDQTIAGVKTFSTAPVVPDGSFSIAKTTGLQAALDAKAVNTAVVHNTGSETIAGTKTFSSAPVVPDSSFTIAKTSGLQAALDSKLSSGAVVNLTGNQTISGVKTFSSAPVVPDASFAIAKVSGLQAALDSKATSTGVVTLDTAQTFTGVKTFSVAPVVPANAFGQDRINGLVTALAAKAPTASPTFTGTVSGITKAMVGLGNVDNTAPANLPVSDATQDAIDAVAASTSGKEQIHYSTWNGASWSSRPSGIPSGVPNVYYSTADVTATPPPTPVTGDLWITHPAAA